MALQLKGTAEVGGAQVTVALTLTLQPGKSYMDAAYALTADKALKVAAFRGPWLWAGEGTFGEQQDLALFPGSEYMETGERSSSTLDIAAPMNVRFAPHPNTVTVPSMAVEKDGCIVGLMWDPLQKWDGEHDRPTAVFASPNFIEGHANHLLGLCLPSIPDYLEPNKLLAKTAYELKPGAKLTLSAALYAEAKSEVLRSMDLYFERYGLPELPPKPRSYEDTVAMSLKSYDTVLWDEAARVGTESCSGPPARIREWRCGTTSSPRGSCRTRTLPGSWPRRAAGWWIPGTSPPRCTWVARPARC